MRKMKKLVAMLLALAMVMGMSLTAFGAPVTTQDKTISLSGLAAGETQDVKVYQVLSYDDTGKWVVADWAADYVTLGNQNGSDKFEVKNIDWASMAAPGTAPTDATQYGTTISIAADVTSTTINVAPGAYLIHITTTSTGDTTVYTNVGAVTNWDAATNSFKNATAVAKSSEIGTSKKVDAEIAGTDDKKFVERGEKVPFVIETIFPYFADKDASGNPVTSREYYILDTPSGLEDISNVDVEVKIGDTTITSLKWVAVEKAAGVSEDAPTQYKLDLSAYANVENTNAGKTVIVKYTGVVDDPETYFNVAASVKDGKDLETGENPDPDPDPEDPDPQGELGKITINKVDAADANKKLNGATFNVFKVNDNGEKVGSAILFVVSDAATGTYNKAKTGETGSSADVVTAGKGADDKDLGQIILKGLDEGTYLIEETKAPTGYTINAKIDTKTIDGKTTKNVTYEVSDTVLSSLPSTGGMGTMIFTIGGCLIMIIAAGLFFTSRRKSAK